MISAWPVGARLGQHRNLYAVHLEVVLPPSFSPRIVLQPHQRVVIDEPFEAVEFEEFLRQSDRIMTELQAIVDTVKRDWRFSDEDRHRFRELGSEFEMLSAQLERTRATLN